MQFHEKYQEQLFNIESSIIQCYRQDENISDYDVIDALEVLISDFRAR